MEVVLIAAVVVTVWIILNHMRKQQFLKEYMELQRKALEKGVTLPEDLKENAIGKTEGAVVAFRVGVISLVVGITGVIIGAWILPNQAWSPNDTDTAAIFASFWGLGLLLAAFGIGNLITWFVMDKKRGRRSGKEK